MRDVAARTVSRLICAAYIMAFAGLRDSHYDADEVLHPFLQKYGLLTEEEWEALRKRGGFAGHPASAATGEHNTRKKKQDPSLHGPDDGVIPKVLVARPRRHGLL